MCPTALHLLVQSALVRLYRHDARADGGWGWQSVHDPKVLPEVMERWRTAIATEGAFDMEFPLLVPTKFSVHS